MGAFPDERGVRPPGAPPAGRLSIEPAVPPAGAPPLGRLLVERGLLNEEQLATGLAEQGRTGEPLGKVFIKLGFVDATFVAQALATQHGGLLKSEYGFATGFGAGRPAAPVGEPPLSPASSDAAPVPSGLRLAPVPAVSADESPASAEATPSPGHPPLPESLSAAVSAEPPADEVVESAQVEPVCERLAPVNVAPVEPPAMTAAAWVSGADETGGVSGTIVTNDRRDNALRDLQTIAAERDLLSSEAVSADRGAARMGLDAAARITDLEAELVSAQAERDVLRSRIAELEAEVANARLAAETATSQCGAARVDAENAAARVEQLERELSWACDADKALRSENDRLRSENDRLRAAVAEESPTGQQLREHLVGKRLADVERRLDAVFAQVAALQGMRSG